MIKSPAAVGSAKYAPQALSSKWQYIREAKIPMSKIVQPFERKAKRLMRLSSYTVIR
jgi:hypothetical protein